jgi:hypothetical protein
LGSRSDVQIDRELWPSDLGVIDGTVNPLGDDLAAGKLLGGTVSGTLGHQDHERLHACLATRNPQTNGSLMRDLLGDLRTLEGSVVTRNSLGSDLVKGRSSPESKRKA